MLAYHGTNKAEKVLKEGLIAPFIYCCNHICLSNDPRTARNFGDVLVINLAGLDLPNPPFFGGEMRLHYNIPAWRISRYVEDVEPSFEGFLEPGQSDYPNHIHCAACYA